MRLFMVGWIVLSVALAYGNQKVPLVKAEKASRGVLRVGQSGESRLVFTVTKGFHVQANPASETYLIPTELKLDEHKDFQVTKLHYPECGSKSKTACKPHKIQGSKKAINAYDGTFNVGVSLQVKASAKPGRKELSGKLRYQACNDKTCFFPTAIPISMPFDVVN